MFDCEVLAINNINGSLFDWLYLQDIANQIYNTLVTQFLIFNCIARFRKIPVKLRDVASTKFFWALTIYLTLYTYKEPHSLSLTTWACTHINWAYRLVGMPLHELV